MGREQAIPPLRRRRRGKYRKRQRVFSLDAELRASAQQIYELGHAEAMRAAAMLVVARKLDEVKAILVAAGLSSGAIPPNNAVPGVATQPAAMPPPPPAPPAPAAAMNPCVQCGRAGVYKSKPSPFNRTGSWFCRAHLALGTTSDLEDKMDQVLAPGPQPGPPPGLAPAPSLQKDQTASVAPGASSLSEAMGLAQVINE